MDSRDVPILNPSNFDDSEKESGFFVLPKGVSREKFKEWEQKNNKIDKWLKTLAKYKYKDSTHTNGPSREKLKDNLQNQIVQERLEKLKQRFYKSGTAELEPDDKDHFPNNKEEQKCENNSDAEDQDYVESDQEIEEEQSSDSDSEVVTQKKKKSKEASKFLDDEAIDSDQEQCAVDESSGTESESQSENESDTEENNLVTKKGRILKAFEDSDDECSQNNRKETSTAQEINSEDLGNDQIDNAKLSSIDQDFITPDLKVLKESEDLFNSQATDFTFNEPSISEEIGTNNLEALFDAPSQVNNDDDLLDLCSGQFASTPSQMVLTNNDFKFSQNVLTNTTETESDNFVSQVPERKEKELLDDSFVVEVPESNPESPKIDENASKRREMAENQKEPTNAKIDTIEDDVNAQPGKKSKKLLESTDDEQEQNSEVDKKKIKRKKKKKEKVKKLGFSDDEDEELNVISTDMLDEESLTEDENVDDPEVFVDYDSEENEIEVKLTKKDREKVAKNYFENEAELSESEWGSADEDEKGLDKYDTKLLADDEEFDQDQLREEVGRIHARKVMDEDIKNVKKIQDLLFEDEENDGVGRERKFRWKNQTDGFAVNDENALDVDDLASAEQEEENEIMWRRMRHERELLINEQSQKMADSDTMSTDILLLDQNSQTVTTASTTSLVKRKFQIIKTNSSSFGVNLSSESNKIDSPFLIKTATSKKFAHSSFLSRDEQTLCKIASFISTKEDEVTNLSSHGSNSMSFAPIEKKEECKKRKSEGNNQPNSSGKKRKVENQRFLLDQLK